MIILSVKSNFSVCEMRKCWTHASWEITLKNLLIPMLHATTPRFKWLFLPFWPILGSTRVKHMSWIIHRWSLEGAEWKLIWFHIIRYSRWALERFTLFVMGPDSIQFNSLWALDTLNWINHTAGIHSAEGELKQMQNISGFNLHGCWDLKFCRFK